MKVLKNLVKAAFAVSCLVFAGCQNIDSGTGENAGYGIVRLCTTSDRGYSLEDLCYARVTADGYGMSTVTGDDYISLNNGKASGGVIYVPVGKNRVISVYAYNSNKEKLGTTLIRAVTDISSGTNTVAVTAQTTALANVYYELIQEDYDVTSLSQGQIKQLSDVAGSSSNWSLVDSKQIAKDFVGKSLKSSSDYKLSTGTVSFNNNYEGCTIQIGDTASSKVTSVATGSGTISNVAPGTWPVYITKADGTIEKSYVTVKANSTTAFGDIGHETVKGKIIAHVQTSSGYKNVYAWISGNEQLFGAWPGSAMTDSDGDGWYDVTIEKTSSNLIFNDGGSGKTSDLSREEGEWWYKDSTWYDVNPDDSEAPVLESFTCSKTGVLSGTVEFEVSATDNKLLKNATVSVDGTSAGSVTLSGTVLTGTFNLDTTNYANGSHTVSCVVYDAAGNVSESKSLTFTFTNANSAPVAVISGTTRCAPGKSVTFSAEDSTDKNGTVKAYKWTVSGGVTASGTDSTITVTAPSTEDSSFTVTLKVQDDEGEWSSEVSQTVTVKTNKSNDFREESIYFLMTARWYDGDTDNNRWCRPDIDGTTGNMANGDYPWRGDFKGVIEKLDYIKAMGFSAIWITPPVLNRSDYDFHGYHAWNMNKIDPRLESSDMDYQKFIDACHAKGIKVIQDIVLNHSCRYGLEDLGPVKYYGSKNITWSHGKGIGSDYYDDYNPNFTYNGLDYEPNSGRNFYNGDLWQESKPSLSWNPDLSDWGTYNSQYDYYLCQWPTLKLFNPEYYHQIWLGNWEDETCQTGTIHEDCIDLNTESEAVQNYLINAYSKYIKMGVDAFRIDTVKHVSRVMFNRHFVPAFKKAAEESGNDHFYMFGEVCTRVNEVWNHGVAPLSAPFYTWAERSTYSDDDSTAVHEGYTYENDKGTDGQPTSDNHYLNGNSYHTPDYSNASGLNVIDFPMHWNFSNASAAYNMRGCDKYYNDATYNVVYVDSHDYGPNTDNRYDGGTNAWAENMTYMWTFRGIPCLYYGSEIEFQAGVKCDNGSSSPLSETGRAYYGTNLEGSVTATDYGEWKDASGTLAETMQKPLIPHLARLNKIRRAIPALQKGQYSNDNCNGNMCFKRRFTDTADGVDSFVLVSISGGATFSGLPAGTYLDVVTGDKQTISEGGTVTASCSGTGNARIYVLQNSTASNYGANKVIGSDTNWLKK